MNSNLLLGIFVDMKNVQKSSNFSKFVKFKIFSSCWGSIWSGGPRADEFSNLGPKMLRFCFRWFGWPPGIWHLKIFLSPHSRNVSHFYRIFIAFFRILSHFFALSHFCIFLHCFLKFSKISLNGILLLGILVDMKKTSKKSKKVHIL